MNVLFAGATGLTGKFLLHLLLQKKEVDKVHLLLRRSINSNHPKVAEHVIDFNSLELFSIKDRVDVVISTLGTTMKKAGSKEAFYRVDHDYIVELASWAKKNQVPTFIYISSIGASSKSFVSFYLRVKGETEEDIQKLNLDFTFVLRPSLLVGPRDEHRPLEVWSEKVFKVIKPLMVGKLKSQMPVHASQVANAIFKVMVHNKEKYRIIKSVDILNFPRFTIE
ncbi:MAG: NAD-dependent epimerase/dehydratase family protein [Bacteroidales bacterium]|nr:NAD-dependent epimerase/dehydratase family protein [Bacteroidales bacterium]